MNFHKKWGLDPFLKLGKLINSYSGHTVYLSERFGNWIYWTKSLKYLTYMNSFKCKKQMWIKDVLKYIRIRKSFELTIINPWYVVLSIVRFCEEKKIPTWIFEHLAGEFEFHFINNFFCLVDLLIRSYKKNIVQDDQLNMKFDEICVLQSLIYLPNSRCASSCTTV